MCEGIVVAGNALVDVINSVTAYPMEGALSQIMSVSRACGGCVCNVAVDLKKLCPQLPVFACAKIGKDDNGKYILDTLEQSGVDTTNVHVVDNAQTSFTQVMSIPGGQRTFFTYPGTSSAFGAEDVNLDNIQPTMFHLGYFLLLQKIDDGDGLQILKKLIQHGIKTSIDLVSEDSDRYRLVIPCLQYVDYLIINELEAGHLTHMEPTMENLPLITEKLLKMGVREKVIVHFRDGAICRSNGNVCAVGSYRLPHELVAGSTGAGDAFCAGTLLGIYKGMSDTDVLKLGICAAAASLRNSDAVSGMEDVNSLQRIYSKFERNRLCLPI